MAHLWVCAPFLMIWMQVPVVRRGIPESGADKIQAFIVVIVAYLIVRTWLAFRDPPSLPWEYVFPPIDVAVVSVLIWFGNRDPLSNIALLYFFPIAEAAGTLNVAWTASVGALVLAGAGLATHGFRTEEPFNTGFRYFFIIVMAALLSALAKAAARARTEQGVAQDRVRIAMEMHDGVQGHLMTISRQLELAEALGERDPRRAAEVVAESREGARLAADELRFLVQRLRAPSLAEGFLPGLKQFAHNLVTRNGMELRFEVHGEPYELGETAENALFRIAQESLTNAVRHSGATEVRVDVEFDLIGVALKVRDNGVGLPGEKADGFHAGIESMSERAQEVGGSVKIESVEGGGVLVSAYLPRQLEKHSPWRRASKS